MLYELFDVKLCTNTTWELIEFCMHTFKNEENLILILPATYFSTIAYYVNFNVKCMFCIT